MSATAKHGRRRTLREPTEDAEVVDSERESEEEEEEEQVLVRGRGSPNGLRCCLSCSPHAPEGEEGNQKSVAGACPWSWSLSAKSPRVADATPVGVEGGRHPSFMSGEAATRRRRKVSG